MKNKLIIAIIFLLFVVVLLAGFYFFIQSEVKKPSGEGNNEVAFEVKEDQGLKEIAKNLKEFGLIKNDFYFLIWILQEGKAKQILAGNYCLSPKMSIVDIIEKFTKEGEGIPSITKLTFPEGWRISQIEERFITKGLIEEGNILKFKVKDFKEEYSFLSDAPDDTTLEGYLFPDTYFFYCSSPQILCEEGKGEIIKCEKGERKEIIKKFLTNFDEKLTSDLREQIKKQKKIIFDVIIMASLLEKEVNTKEDKKIVSGILWKRLEEGIPLQVDATITYLTDKRTTEISIEETKIDSPYNTYKYKGLPFGPISNPGLESILAAISPQYSNFWFYLSTPDGKTIFSKTLEEHNIAKAKYLK